MNNTEKVPTKRPRGRPPFAPGSFADPGPRGRYLVEKFGTAQILQWYEALKIKEERKKVPLSAADCLIIGRLARAQFDGLELERFHDRTFGKVPDRNINLNVNT